MVKSIVSGSRMKKSANRYEVNLRKIIFEKIATSIGAGFSLSIMTEFWNSVGMNQTKIGFVQMMYTIAVLFFDLPMGYIADRFNRKLLNIIGDVGVAFAFLFYAFSKNMYMVLVAECSLGVFNAMTNGVDEAFMKVTANKINPSSEYFKNVTRKSNTIKNITFLIVMLLGGFISKISMRLAIGISFIPYVLGAIVALSIEDYGEKAVAKHSNPIKDMYITVKDLVKAPKTRAYMLCFILGKEITHSQIWVFTPLLKSCGVPIEFACIGWILNELMKIIGSEYSKKIMKNTMSTKFGGIVLIEMMWLLVLIIHTNIFTVWLFALNGFVMGCVDSTLKTPMQEETKDEIQTQVMSIASTGARLLYIPMIYFVNYLGDIKLELALLGVLVVFLPLCLKVYTSLKKIKE
ncbi:MAG: MFS transporter [Clostridia bacterium]|nr:MFS transporter [Clostridia bacterium]